MRYGPTANDGEFETILRICEVCFAPGEQTRIREWLGKFDASAFRVVRNDAGKVRACLTRLDMGQYFGGRAVSMTGVAGVGVAPEDRGGGWARMLMEAFVREAREDGFALSTLYASTQRLYRKAAYEAAGHSYRYAIPPEVCRVIDEAPSSEPVTLRPGGEADWEGIRECFERGAPMRQGEVARGKDIWRYMRGRKRPNECVVAEGAQGTVEGYCLYQAEWEPEGASTGPHARQIVTVHDLMYTTVPAAVRLLEFLAGFGTLCREVRMFGGPTMGLLQILRDHRYTVMLMDHWMVRVLDVKKALEQRGYPAAVCAEIALELTDPMFEENAGRWVLRVADGRGRVEKSDAGGGAALRMDVRTLAPLYTGFLSAGELASVGRIEGDEAMLGVASAVFAAAAPMMTVRF